MECNKLVNERGEKEKELQSWGLDPQALHFLEEIRPTRAHFEVVDGFGFGASLVKVRSGFIFIGLVEKQPINQFPQRPELYPLSTSTHSCPEQSLIQQSKPNSLVNW